MKSIRMAATAVVAAGLLAVCATAAAVGSTTKSVTISVASLIPGSTPQAIAQFNAQVTEFEKANPSIKIKPVEYQWTGPTFAAKLAARTLPTVFEVPFTDARTLGDNGQLADLTALAKALPYFSKYNKAVLAEGTDDHTRSRLKDLHSRYYKETTPLLRRLPGAQELLEAVEKLGLQAVLATSTTSVFTIRDDGSPQAVPGWITVRQCSGQKWLC